jgi:hypothetical protein
MQWRRLRLELRVQARPARHLGSDHSVADLGDGLDMECAAAEFGPKIAKLRDCSVDGVVADNPPLPTARE